MTARRTHSRRLLLVGAALAAGSAAGAFAWQRNRRIESQKALDLAEESHRHRTKGALQEAVAAAVRARQLDPSGRQPALAYLHASATLAIDGQGAADAAVQLLTEARVLGAQKEELAIASLATAATLGNGRLAAKMVALIDEKPYGAKPMFHFARGAALDRIGAKHDAKRAYQVAVRGEPAFVPARIRLVRAAMLCQDFEEAQQTCEALPNDCSSKAWLECLLGHITGGGSTPPNSDSVELLPRSVRGMAKAILEIETSVPGAAAAPDFDSPVAAATCATLALNRGLDALAERMLQIATRLHDPVDDVVVVRARLALRHGNLAQALTLAGEGPHKQTQLLLKAIEAYEASDAKRLESLEPECRQNSAWSLVTAALGILGRRPKPTATELDSAFRRGEPWADMLVLDLALRENRLDEARRVVHLWHERGTEPRKRRARRLDSG